MNNRLIKSNDAGAGACTNTVDLYNPFPDGGGLALYQLNGDATDVSGNYDGTASNVTYGAGQFGQAGVFNGSSSKIDFSSPILPSSGGFAISWWMKWNGDADYAFLFDTSGGGAGNGMYCIVHDVSDKIYWNFKNSSYGTNIEVSYPPSERTQWTHFVISWDGTTSANSAKIYKNTVASSGTQTVSQTTSQQNFKIGYVGVENFNGSIDQVRIFSRALRPYEVEALYTEEYCTPTIVPSEHFNTVLYTGNSGTQSITSVGFAPDLTWIKERTGTDHHRLQDTVRGAGYRLYSSTTSAEGYTNDSITSFDANGFSLGSSLGVNESGQNYVAWNFKAGGAAVTNTDGTITSQVSANTEAGFSVVTFTGNGSTASVGHGLGQKPSIIFTKNRSASEGWFTQQYMYVPSGNAAYGYLNTTAAFTGFTDSITNDTVMQQGGTNGQNYVSYCFAEVEGFSNFGSYVGTGAAGNTIVTGFEPAFVMIKRTDAAASWYMIDNKRSPENVRDRVLFANLSNAEQQGQGAYYYPMNFLENGFELTQAVSDGYNANGGKYIYMAFAADPTAVEPTLEDSFNTVLYTGNGSAQSVTGVGFQPDFTWIKDRTTAYHHILQDSVRGINSKLGSDGTWEENNAAELSLSYGQITSFDSNGFTVNGTSQLNRSGDNFVSWNWKGAEIPAINSNGSIPSVVSANPAAGFSIVSCTSTGNADTIGHGLGVAPSVIIYKTRSTTGNWSVYHQSLGNTRGVYLNLTSAAVTSQFFWNNTSPTSDVFTAYGSAGNTHIAYCFAEVAGFSKFGSFVGNGTTVSITTDFEPAFVLWKNTSQGSASYDFWFIVDNKRSPSNPIQKVLYPNDSLAESTTTYDIANFNSNGFDIVGNQSGNRVFNNAGDTYIYMAFANQF